MLRSTNELINQDLDTVLRSTIGFINQDLDTVKEVFLKTIDEHYAELSLSDIEPQKKRFSFSFYSQSKDESEDESENKIEMADTFDELIPENYGNLNIGKARNWTTDTDGFNRLINFFNQTKNCNTVDEFMHRVYKIYSEKRLDNNFGIAIAIATAKIALIKQSNNNLIPLLTTLDKEKINLTYIHDNAIWGLFRDNKALAGDLILRQIKDYNLGFPIQNLQQVMHRINENKYFGDKLLAKEYDKELRQRVEHSASMMGAPMPTM